MLQSRWGLPEYPPKRKEAEILWAVIWAELTVTMVRLTEEISFQTPSNASQLANAHQHRQQYGVISIKAQDYMGVIDSIDRW